MLPEQFCGALACRQQAGQHFHRRRFAAAVRAQESEDFTPGNAETDRVDGDEVIEPFRQTFRLDGDVEVHLCGQWRDLDRPVVLAAAVRKQRHEGRVE